MKKSIVSFLLVTIFFISSLSGCPLWAAEIDLDEKIREDNVPTYIREGIRFVPLDDLARILKAKLSFGISERRAFLFYQNHKISLIAGCSDILVDGNLEKMEPSPQFIEGMFVVPLSRVKEILSRLEVSPQEEVVESLPSIEEAIALSSETPSEASSPLIETAIVSSTDTSRKKIVVLDPGHGGRDPGAIGEQGLREKDVNLDIALRLNNLLEKRKELVVLMTRKTDKHLGWTTREDLGNRVKFANQQKADLFLSLHTNSSPRWDKWNADGFETYCPRSKAADYNNADSSEITNDADLRIIVDDLNEGTVLEESERFATLIQEELGERLDCPNRGVKKRNFYVLKYTQMPSALVEIGFICNPNIEANLRDPQVRQAIAETLYKAIIRYFQER